MSSQILYAYSYKSEKHLENVFFIIKCSYVDFKMGAKVIKCNNRSFLHTVFFFLWSNNKLFLNFKKGRSLSEGLG